MDKAAISAKNRFFSVKSHIFYTKKAAREPSHEDSRTAWSCLLWSRDVRVTPTSRCDYALTAPVPVLLRVSRRWSSPVR